MCLEAQTNYLFKLKFRIYLYHHDIFNILFRTGGEMKTRAVQYSAMCQN